MPKATLSTPFRGLLPPLSAEEFSSLKDDIKSHGVLQPVVIDEIGNILDGHHRYRVDKNAPTVSITGLSDAEKRAFVQSSNMKRRNLSPEQKAEVRQQMIATAKALKEEDSKKWTQVKIAKAFGVSREVVSDWLDISNGSPTKAYIDARVSVPKDRRQEIVDRVESGDRQADIAADFGISQPRVTQIAVQEKKRSENKASANAIAEKKVEPTFGKLYDVVVIDPPWPMEKIDRDVRPQPIRV